MSTSTVAQLSVEALILYWYAISFAFILFILLMVVRKVFRR